MAETQERAFPYVVKQGDHLYGIALRHCCRPGEIWDHLKNQKLREQRGDGSQLCPNDLIWIPLRQPQKHRCLAGQVNTYQVSIPKVRASFVLRAGGNPLAEEPYRVIEPHVEGELRTGPDGSVSVEVPAHQRQVILYLPKRDRQLVMMVGNLDPLGEGRGLAHRLANLGFLTHEETMLPGIVCEATRRFQAASKLPVTGALDDATRKVLLEKHGS
jgi:hypothetical protein